MKRPRRIFHGAGTVAVLIVLLSSQDPAHAQQELYQRAEQVRGQMVVGEDVEAEVVSKTGCCPATVRLAVRRDGLERDLYVSGRIESVRDLAFVGDDRLLLAANMPMSGGTALHLVDLRTMQQEQVIKTYGYGVSPSGRWLAYQSHYPRMGLPQARRSIFLLYDLTKPPAGNRPGPETEWPEPNLGQPIFPEENVEEKTWSIFAADQTFYLNSSFLWSADEERLVFIASTYLDPDGWPTCYVVSIHLSDRGRVAAIRRRELTEENVEMPFKTAAYARDKEEGRPLCLGTERLGWAEEGLYDRVVAEPALPGSSLGAKVWIEVP